MIAALLCVHSARAQTLNTWIGGTSGTWNTGSNWSAGVTTDTTMVAVFNSGTFAGVVATSATSNTSTMDAIWLGGSLNQDVTFNSATASIKNLSLTGTGSVNSVSNTAILLDSTTAHNLTIGSKVNTIITNNTAFTINNSGTLTISGTLTLGNSGNRTLTLAGNNASAVFAINGTITGTGSGLIINTPGAVNLAGAETYTGATTINNGTVTMTGTFGNTAISANGGTLNLNAAGAVNQNTLTLNGSIFSESVDNALGGTAGLTMGTNSGSVTLSHNNNFTGTITLNGGILTTTTGGINGTDTTNGIVFNTGTLKAAAGGISTAKNVTMTGAGTFDVNGNSSTLSGTISGAGGLTVIATGGNGSLILAGANTYSGATTINAGILQIGNGGATGSLSGSTAISGSAGGTLAFNRSDAMTISNTISGSIAVSQIGSGTTTLTGRNTYTGTTTVTAGELDLNSATTNGAVGGDITVNGGVLKLLGNNQIADTSTAVISSGTLDFNGKNETIKNLTNSGGTVIYSGSIKITDPLWSGGTNTVTGNVTFGELTVSAGVNTVNSGGVLTVGGTSDANTGDSDLTFSGNSSPNINVLSGGKLVLAGNVTVKSDLTAGTASITTDSQSTPGQLDLGGTTRTFTMSGASGTNMIISAQIINGGLTKAGAGLLQLSGNNTYSGTTSVTAGTLQVSGTLQSTASVSVSAGAQLNVNGLVNTSALVSLSGTLSGTGTVGAVNATGGTVSPGNNNNGILNTGNLSLDATSHLSIQMGRTADGGGTLSNSQVNVTGSVTLASGADLQLSITTGQFNPTTGDVIYLVVNDGTDAVSGVFTKLNGTDTNLSEGSDFSFNGVTYQITYTANAEVGSYTGGNDIALEVVPEPGTWGMILGGFGMLIGIQRLRKRQVGI